MDASLYQALHRQARTLARRAQDAEDLVQDALLVALSRDRFDPRWLSGVLRNLAAMQARSAGRRRRREQLAYPAEVAGQEVGHEALAPEAILPRMPQAAQCVLRLALHGLDGDEVRWILGLTPAAFRQRLLSIRRALATLPEGARQEAFAQAMRRAGTRGVGLPLGRVRRSLKAALGNRPGLATHDIDGHLLVLRGAHVWSSPGNQD